MENLVSAILVGRKGGRKNGEPEVGIPGTCPAKSDVRYSNPPQNYTAAFLLPLLIAKFCTGILKSLLLTNISLIPGGMLIS